MTGGAEAVVQRWLEPPYELDGWRVDVANMAGPLPRVRVPDELPRDARSRA